MPKMISKLYTIISNEIYNYEYNYEIYAIILEIFITDGSVQVSKKL